jgi:hypothetical protein
MADQINGRRLVAEKRNLAENASMRLNGELRISRIDDEREVK